MPAISKRRRARSLRWRWSSIPSRKCRKGFNACYRLTALLLESEDYGLENRSDFRCSSSLGDPVVFRWNPVGIHDDVLERG
jgi:hypothetical protein